MPDNTRTTSIIAEKVINETELKILQMLEVAINKLKIDFPGGKVDSDVNLITRIDSLYNNAITAYIETKAVLRGAWINTVANQRYADYFGYEAMKKEIQHAISILDDTPEKIKKIEVESLEKIKHIESIDDSKVEPDNLPQEYQELFTAFRPVLKEYKICKDNKELYDGHNEGGKNG